MRVPVVQPQRSESSRPGVAANRILAAFPGPVMLYPSYVRRSRWRIVGAIGLALALPAYGLYVSSHEWTPEWVTGMAAIAIAALAYTAFEEFVYSTGRRKLILDADGFDYRGTVRRHRRWHEVRDFSLTFYEHGAYVEFSESAPRSLWWWIRTGLGRTNLIFEKFEDLTSEELCDLMNRWRARALAEADTRAPR